MLLFVSIWNRGDTKANNKRKERQNKTTNKDEIHLFEAHSERLSLSTSPWQSIPRRFSPSRKVACYSQVWINSRLFLHAQRTAHILGIEGKRAITGKNKANDLPIV